MKAAFLSCVVGLTGCVSARVWTSDKALYNEHRLAGSPIATGLQVRVIAEPTPECPILLLRLWHLRQFVELQTSWMERFGTVEGETVPAGAAPSAALDRGIRRVQHETATNLFVEARIGSERLEGLTNLRGMVALDLSGQEGDITVEARGSILWRGRLPATTVDRPRARQLYIGATKAPDLVIERKMLEDCIRLDPGFPEPHLARGHTAAQAGDFAEAVKSYAEYSRRRPSSVLDRVFLRRVASCSALAEAVQPPPPGAQLAFEWGVTSSQFGDIDGALASFEDALALAPWWSAVHFNLGRLYSTRNRKDDAAFHLGCYLAAAPGAPDAGQVRKEIMELQKRSEER